MTIEFSLSFLLGVVITLSLSSLIKTNSENAGSLIPPDQQAYLPLVETIVDSRFKLLAADFQDQIDDLKSKVVTLESSKINSKDDILHVIKKRQTNEMVQEPGKVKGIPSSCTDLKHLGHKMNGVYLIKTSRPGQGVKVEAVFCDFQSSVSAISHLIGSVKTTTKNIFFYAQRNSPFSQSDSVIPWELERLNEGGAFNLISGVFVAPVPGIYHFTFHGVKDQAMSYLDIILQLNGNTFATAITGITGSFDSLSLSATLRLKAYDRVNLFNSRNGFVYPTGNLHDVGHYHVTHFSGWLMEEDLI